MFARKIKRMKKIKLSRNELLQLKIWVCDITLANHIDSQDSQERIDILTGKIMGALELKLSNLPNENSSLSD